MSDPNQNTPKPPTGPPTRPAAEAKAPVETNTEVPVEAGVTAPHAAGGEEAPERIVSSPSGTRRTGGTSQYMIVAHSTCIVRELVDVRDLVSGKTYKRATGREQSIPSGASFSSAAEVCKRYGCELEDVQDWLRNGHMQLVEHRNGRVVKAPYIPPGGGTAPVDISDTFGGEELDRGRTFRQNKPGRFGWNPENLRGKSLSQLRGLIASGGALMDGNGNILSIPDDAAACIDILSQDF